MFDYIKSIFNYTMRALHLDNSYDPIMLKDACMNNDFNTIKMLMEKYNLQKEDIVNEIYWFESAFNLACRHCDYETILFFIEKYNLNKEDILRQDLLLGRTNLHVAICRHDDSINRFKIVELLLTICINENLQKKEFMLVDMFDHTILFEAILRHQYDIVELLINTGMVCKEDIIKENNSGESAYNITSNDISMSIRKLFDEIMFMEDIDCTIKDIIILI